MSMTATVDQLSRPLRDLRISVTDRCSLRCPYCMPREAFGRDHAFMAREELHEPPRRDQENRDLLHRRLAVAEALRAAVDVDPTAPAGKAGERHPPVGGEGDRKRRRRPYPDEDRSAGKRRLLDELEG